MLFNSINFIIFFPIVVLIYFICPAKIKHLWLLATSYFFYMCWNAKYALLLLGTTVITYSCSLLISYFREHEKKAVWCKLALAGSLVLNLGMLVYFKYTNFFFDSFRKAMSLIHVNVDVPSFDILLPVGISFFTFQALGYTIDVYRGTIYAEKNFFRYALFVSFFPQLVAGPIERSKNLLKQLAEKTKFNFDNFREGILLMIWGYFMKIVLADRIALLVDTVYADIDTYPGWYLIVASVLFAFQIYCDFAGYSTIAMGAALILNIRLMENFNAPYLSNTVSLFWRNWHISLTSWFKDYLYIPLGGNRKGKLRKYFNELVVFSVSGLWHGANFTYIIWGALNGVYQVVGEALMPVRNKLAKIFNLNRESLGHKIAGTLITFGLVDLSWVFFRASGLKQSLKIIKSIFTANNPWIFFDGSLFKCGLNRKNYYLMIFSLLILLISDICKKKNIVVRKVILSQDYWCRLLCYVVAVIFIMIFGIWGPSLDESAFIYFQF